MIYFFNEVLLYVSRIQKKGFFSIWGTDYLLFLVILIRLLIAG